MNIISMIRGDTTPLMFQRKDNNGDVIKLRADKIYFTVKKSDLPDEVLFQKTIDDMTLDEDGTYHFVIQPEDTNNLEFGNYMFDLEVIQDNVVSTISTGVFAIKKEVTFARNEV